MYSSGSGDGSLYFSDTVNNSKLTDPEVPQMKLGFGEVSNMQRVWGKHQSSLYPSTKPLPSKSG